MHHLFAKGVPEPFVERFGLIPPYYETRAGLYCVSATMLQNVYSPVAGPYRADLEPEYQSLKMLAPLFRAYWQSPEARAWALHQINEAELQAHWLRYDWLRFSRLSAYLRLRQPDAVIGHSIFIHRLTAEEVDQVLNRRYSDWQAALDSVAR